MNINLQRRGLTPKRSCATQIHRSSQWMKRAISTFWRYLPHVSLGPRQPVYSRHHKRSLWGYSSSLGWKFGSQCRENFLIPNSLSDESLSPWILLTRKRCAIIRELVNGNFPRKASSRDPRVKSARPSRGKSWQDKSSAWTFGTRLWSETAPRRRRRVGWAILHGPASWPTFHPETLSHESLFLLLHIGSMTCCEE